jgi:pimeloyl-ACP methyl ester carboxylesterase
MMLVDLAERLTAFKEEHPYRAVTVGDTAWRYRTGGVLAAPAVLLLPGGTLVPEPFFIVLDALGQRYRVIAPAYPATHTMAELVAGLSGILDVERIPVVNVVGSSFGGYLAQCFVRAHPDRVNSLVLAQTGVRHFVGARPITAMRWLFQASPDRVVHWLVWRTWRVLLADIGPNQQFWTSLLRSILYTELTKSDLVAMMAAISDFTAHYRPKPEDLTGWSRPVLVLQSERDRAFAAQADEIRAAYPSAVFHIIAGAGHGALFSHTDEYIEQIQTFLAKQPTPKQPT